MKGEKDSESRPTISYEQLLDALRTIKPLQELAPVDAYVLGARAGHSATMYKTIKFLEEGNLGVDRLELVENYKRWMNYET
jgi:hypothetical protein